MRTDADWMGYAARLGHRALGTTAENPPVGCVIVKEGRVLGVGCTAPGGRPHAEVQALAMVGTAARGATAYVTLEPCSHHGKTPPCADALIAAGVARVVVAVGDPDPRVSGAGLAHLREAGIEVDLLPSADAAHDLAGFLTRIAKNRPYVTLKLAVSADGMMAAKPGERTQITGAEVKNRVHMLRAQSDAILIGRRTLEVDDPELNVRLPGLDSRSPRATVLSRRLYSQLKGKIFSTSAVLPAWILTGEKTAPDQSDTVISCGTAGAGVDLLKAMSELARRGINRLMVEGGAEVAASFLAADLVDEAWIFQSLNPLGSGGVKAPLHLLAALNPVAREKLGADTLTVYQRA